VKNSLCHSSYDEIVIGGSLSALLYSFTKGVPVFFTVSRCPHEFDYFDEIQDVELLKSQSNLFNTPAGQVSLGQKKAFLWEKLYFILNLCGLVPSANLANSFRFSENELKIFNEYSKIATIRFKKATVFDCENSNLKTKKENERYIILDWVSVHSGGRHDIDLIEATDDFVNEIWFYESRRVSSKIKDACIISYIDQRHLDTFEYSDTYARFKAEKIMKNFGMKGASNGVDVKTGKKKYYAIKTSCSRREILNRAPPRITEDASIVLNQHSEGFLLSNMAPGNKKIKNIMSKLCT
jgi:hypothetical protein|tara:strand:+ start:40125 stop:41009 length:885 start_codon:yes stop_codon:yes gene_type:complete